MKLNQKQLRTLINEAIQGRQPGSPLWEAPGDETFAGGHNQTANGKLYISSKDVSTLKQILVTLNKSKVSDLAAKQRELIEALQNVLDHIEEDN